jgi:hypothetical protein
MVSTSRIELEPLALQASVQTTTQRRRMVGVNRVELSLALGPKPSAIPLGDTPMALKTGFEPVILPLTGDSSTAELLEIIGGLNGIRTHDLFRDGEAL